MGRISRFLPSGGLGACGVLAAGMLAAGTAHAANVAYAVLQDGVLTFSYGEKPEGENVYDFHSGSSQYPPWYDVRSEILSAVFDESMRGYRVASVAFYGFFNGCANMTSVSGLNRLDASGVSNMGSMFSGCESLTEIDLSRWSNSAGSFQMNAAFCNCKSLATVYVSPDFTPTYKTASNTPFIWSTTAKKPSQLTGGNGTVWDDGHRTYERAVIDKTDQPGYFTGRAWIDLDLAGGAGIVTNVCYDLTTASIAAPQVVRIGVPARDRSVYDEWLFDGWEIPAAQVADGVTADAVTGDITVPAGYLAAFSVTAKWKRPAGTYVISYYLGDVRYEGKDETYAYSETADHALLFTNPVVSVGSAFAGWHDNAELTGAVLSKIPAGTYGNLALYAAEVPIGPTNLVWNGSVDGDWSNGRNWTPNKIPTAEDDVTFAGSAQPVTLVPGMSFKSFNLAGDVTLSVTNDYTLSFVITGSGNITKIGAGTLTVSSANTFVGTLTVREGTVTRDGAQAFGLADNGLVVSNATLNLGAYNKSNERHALTLGEGGVVDASGNLQGYSGLARVTLTGNASVRTDSTRPTPPTLCNGELLLGGHTLTKIGAGNLNLTASSWSESDSGVLFVKEGVWRDLYASSVLRTLSNMTLRLAGGATYYESQNLAWGEVRAQTNSLVTCNTGYALRVAKRISGGLTAANKLTLDNGCVYEPLVAGDSLTVSNTFSIGSSQAHKMVIDIGKLDLSSYKTGDLVPLLITSAEVPASRIGEVRTGRFRCPIYTRVREDGTYELGITVRIHGGGAILLR